MPDRALEPLTGDEPPAVAVPRLVEEHGGRLYALGLRFCGSEAEAEDLVQEVFLQAFRKWNQFDGRSSPGTWLYTIASRTCQRMHRKKSGEPARLAPLQEDLPFGAQRMAVVPEDDGPVAAELRREGLERLEATIVELPIEFRLPLVLKEIVGFSVADVAAILDLKPATVKTRLHRARLRLRKALESALPEREVASPVYSRRVCLDLLQAKQEALDRGAEFRFPEGMFCERCSELFATLDLTQDLCARIGEGPLPPRVRAALASAMSTD